jgi:NADH:ubiquinone oxidoreductase subunit K
LEHRNTCRSSCKVTTVAVWLTKIGMFQQVLVKLPNTKFNENPFSHSQILSCVQTDWLYRYLPGMWMYLERVNIFMLIYEECTLNSVTDLFGLLWSKQNNQTWHITSCMHMTCRDRGMNISMQLLLMLFRMKTKQDVQQNNFML